MELHPPILRRRRGGFSLVELLVALALVSVVTTLAWMILDSTRRVGEEIAREAESPAAELWERLDREFNHLLAGPSGLKQEPTLAFASGSGLDLKALPPSEVGAPLETLVSYRLEEAALLRISRSAYSDLAVTNRVLEGVAAFAAQGRLAEGWTPQWPVEGEPQTVPARVRVAVDLGGEAPEVREWFLPLSIQAAPPTETPRPRGGSVRVPADGG